MLYKEIVCILPSSHLSIHPHTVSAEAELWRGDIKWCMIGDKCLYQCMQPGTNEEPHVGQSQATFCSKHFGLSVAQQKVTSTASWQPQRLLYNNCRHVQLWNTQQRPPREVPSLSVAVGISQMRLGLKYPRRQLRCENILWWVCMDTHTILWSPHCKKKCVVMCWVRDSCQPGSVLWTATCLSMLSLSNL